MYEIIVDRQCVAIMNGIDAITAFIKHINPISSYRIVRACGTVIAEGRGNGDINWLISLETGAPKTH